LYYITEFGALKRKSGESVSYFTKRFNKMYTKIPDEIKPTETSAKITFANAFDVEFSLLLRERRSSTLSLMQEETIEVESNILAAERLKTKSDRDRKKQKEDVPSSSNTTTSDPKIDEMDKMLKTLTSELARLKLEAKQPNRPVQEGGNMNPNQFRRPHNAPHIMQRERRNHEDQRIFPPFQNNAVEDTEESDDVEENSTANLDGTELPTSHLTQQEYEDSLISNQFDDQEEEIFQNEPQKKYNLRSKQSGSKPNAQTQIKKTNTPAKQGPSKSDQHQQPIKEGVSEVKETKRQLSPFNLEHEINKIKILVPLVELMKNEPFKHSILKVLKSPAPVISSDTSPSPVISSDTVNLQDENPAITIGLHIENKSDSSPPFYISLNIHDKIMHNCLMDSGASHNVMPKVVMDELGLDITKPYQDLYSFDSKKVKCLGVIKDLVVTLSQLPMKSVVMDIVVADIPPKFGMLLSRSWDKKVGGSLQMDLTYATIPIFGGEHRKLYKEVRLAYIVSDHDNPGNHPIYAVDDEIGSTIFHISDDIPESPINKLYW
jgi:hypothetical protein